MIKHIIFVVLISFWGPFICSQLNYSYRSPLSIPLAISANFGELRPNHFHMGVDFKTNGMEGLPLYSIEDGFISRVKVSPYGYGKVIYIDHPNGVTSVYAHCSAFKGKLDSLVKMTQEKEQNFEVEIYFTEKDLPVKKGDTIALSGNTGSSTAPHLHFELRDTKTEDALNPLLYGFEVADHKAPEIRGIKVYSLTNEGYQIPGKSKYVKVTKGQFGYYVGGDLISVPADFSTLFGGIGFAVEVVDFVDGTTNTCGLYGSAFKAEKDTFFCQEIKRVSFDETRYINSHKDYTEYTVNKRKFHKSFKTDENPLEMYACSKNNGVVQVKPGDTLAMYYMAHDLKGNKAELKFKTAVQEGTMNTSTSIFPSWKYLFPDSSYHFQSDQVEFQLKSLTFYEPTLKNLSLKGTYSIGDPKTPIQQALKVKIKSASKPTVNNYIAVTTAGGRVRPLVTSIEGDWLSAESMFLGSFSIKTDTISPSVVPLNFKETDLVIAKKRLSWKVLESQTSLVDYDLFIDGNWVLLEYEEKSNFVFYNRTIDITGTHELLLITKDRCGNKTEWRKKITFQ
ncbi:MAG: M23 family metallopeptidase [Crocinitomicaceae bacterium]|nr:M23 family metallopeptidase [Crocinitomicaceae bacterium]